MRKLFSFLLRPIRLNSCFTEIDEHFIQSRTGGIFLAKNQDTKKLMRLKDILQILPISKNTLLTGIKSGRFKLRPIKNGRCVFFLAEEVEKMLREITE